MMRFAVLLAGHLAILGGLFGAIVVRGLYLKADPVAILVMLMIYVPAGMIIIYAVPLFTLLASALLSRRISGRGFFHITSITWLLLLPALLNMKWPSTLG